MNKTEAVLGMQITSLLPNESKEVRVHLLEKLSNKEFIPEQAKKINARHFVFKAKDKEVKINI